MRLKWQDSENGATTKKASLTVAGSQIQYRQAGQKDILTIMSSWIINGLFRYLVTNMRNSLSCIFQQQIYVTEKLYKYDFLLNKNYNSNIGGMHMSKMGRPKSDNNKDKIVAVRLTEEEHQRLTMYAKKHSLKMSDVLKNGLHEVLNK